MNKTQDISITNADDVLSYFSLLCKRQYPTEIQVEELSYGFPKIPSLSPSNQAIPDLKVLSPIRSVLNANEDLGRNLNYLSNIDEWNEFYCFPEANDLRTFNQSYSVDDSRIINKSEETSIDFRGHVIKCSEDSKSNGESQFIFLSGTTGVGKTTFVKYHTKTEKINYLAQRKIVSRVKFKILEDKVIHSKGISNGISSPAVLEEYMINSIFRDIIESLRIASDNDNMGLFKTMLEEAISETHNIITLNLEQHGNDQTVLDSQLYNEIEKIDEGKIEEISIPSKLDTIKRISKNFEYILFLDGFDAIEPESIMLEEKDNQGDFLECLESIATGTFSGGGSIYRFLNDSPIVFCISARPITISQLKLSVQTEVNFDQVFGDEKYIVGSPIYKIIARRIMVRANQKGITVDKKTLSLLIRSLKVCLSHIRRDLSVAYHYKLVGIFNHNIREKLYFLRDLADFHLKHVAKKIHGDRNTRKKISTIDELLNYVETTNISELGIKSYEFEKILILDRNEKFVNYFEYDIRGNFKQSSDRGAFDNIFNYRKHPSEEISNYGSMCPFLTKYLIMIKTREEKDIILTDLKAWARDFFQDHQYDISDVQMLIRTGLIMAEFENGDLSFSLTRKGEFLVNKIFYKYTYFERACTSARLPRYIRKLMMTPRKTSGRDWERTSIVNVGLIISHISYIETRMALADEYRISAELERRFSPVVRRLANSGMENSNYAEMLESGFKKALGPI